MFICFIIKGLVCRQKDEAEKKLRSYGIDVKVIPDDQDWISLGGYERRNYSEAEVKHYTESCHYCGGFHEDSPHVGRAIQL